MASISKSIYQIHFRLSLWVNNQVRPTSSTCEVGKGKNYHPQVTHKSPPLSLFPQSSFVALEKSGTMADGSHLTSPARR
ncbi:hypothetical protein CDAR_375601 [Caerostris darwini]|uniref:Uncharacterized protein n=1 Tax=Caerostris darwini TaxID=1538125 RepID=A0AAV4S7Z3_9ARAC|nr:hypothetical protein CDAR_375601 [Caerostris darwini]